MCVENSKKKKKKKTLASFKRHSLQRNDPKTRNVFPRLIPRSALGFSVLSQMILFSPETPIIVKRFAKVPTRI